MKPRCLRLVGPYDSAGERLGRVGGWDGGIRPAGIVTVNPEHDPPSADSFRMIADFRRTELDGPMDTDTGAYWLMRDPANTAQWALYMGRPNQVLSDVLDSVGALTGGAALPPRYSDVLLARVAARIPGRAPPPLGPADGRLSEAWLKACLFWAYGGSGDPQATVQLPTAYELPQYMGPEWPLPESNTDDVTVTHHFTGEGISPPPPFAVLRGRVTRVDDLDVPSHTGGTGSPAPSSGGGGLGWVLGAAALAALWGSK